MSVRTAHTEISLSPPDPVEIGVTSQLLCWACTTSHFGVTPPTVYKILIP